MMKSGVFIIVLLLAMSIAQMAQAIPVLGIEIDGALIAITEAVFDPLELVFFVDSFTFHDIGSSVEVSAMMDWSGEISYSIYVMNIFSPREFLITFSSEIEPVGPPIGIGAPNTVESSLAVSLTDFGEDGVRITPTGNRIQVSTVSDGISGVNMGVDVGLEVTGDFAEFSAGPHAGPGPGPWTGLDILVGFNLSGGSGTALLTGRTTMEPTAEPIPEPGTLLLLGTGLVGLAGYNFRRKRRS